MGRRKRAAGFVSSVFTELMIFGAIAGVATAVFVPQFQRTRRAEQTHACAVRLDALAPDDHEGTCPISGQLYASTAEEPQRRCCPTPQVHEVEALCRVPSDAPLVVAHPAPGRARWVVTGILAGVPSLILAALLVGTIGMAIADEVGRRKRSG